VFDPVYWRTYFVPQMRFTLLWGPSEFSASFAVNKLTGFGLFVHTLGELPAFPGSPQVFSSLSLGELREKANKSISKHQAEMARLHNQKRQDPLKFQVGGMGWLDSADLYPGFSPNKLDPPFVGPFVIVDVP
jgi:hypothetical protein